MIKLKPSEVRKNPTRFSPDKKVTIRCPLGEVTGGSVYLPLSFLDLPKPSTGPILKSDKFNAQGLEGCDEIKCTWAQACVLLAQTRDYRSVVIIHDQ